MTTPPKAFTDLLGKHLKYAESKVPLALDADLRGLGLDSKEAVDLLLDLEDLYGVVFPDELLNNNTFATVGSLWAAVSSIRPGEGGQHG